MKLFRKADMTLNECAKGLRISKLLHKMGIKEDGDFDKNENKFFKNINDCYQLCQTHQISPQDFVVLDYRFSQFYDHKLE